MKATAENENLKIQIAAAESTAAKVFAENQRQQQLLEVNSIIILIDFIHIPTDKRWFNQWSENWNELIEKESIVGTSQGPNDHLVPCRSKCWYVEYLVNPVKSQKWSLNWTIDPKRTGIETNTDNLWRMVLQIIALAHKSLDIRCLLRIIIPYSPYDIENIHAESYTPKIPWLYHCAIIFGC